LARFGVGEIGEQRSSAWLGMGRSPSIAPELSFVELRKAALEETGWDGELGELVGGFAKLSGNGVGGEPGGSRA
jgi:hypothetical protein